MSEAKNILDAIQSQLDTVNDLKRVEINESEIDLVKEGKFPWANVKATTMKLGPADNLRLYDAERHTYTIIITSAVRTKTKGKALSEIWDLYESIKAAIDTDVSFSGTVDDVPVVPAVAVDAAVWDQGRFWIGRGSMSFDVSVDHILR
jgi:hypothetical protein